MALAASLNVNRGEAVARISAAGLAALDMVFLLSSSALRCSLKPARGSPRRPNATAPSTPSFLPAASLPKGIMMLRSSPCLSTSSTRTSSRSYSVDLRISFNQLFSGRLLNLCPQILYSAKLQLLHRPFRFSNRLGNFANAFFFRKTHFNHKPLLRRQLLHQSKKPRALVSSFEICFLTCLFSRIALLARLLPPSVRC